MAIDQYDDLFELPMLTSEIGLTGWHWLLLAVVCWLLSRLILRLSLASLAVAALTVACAMAVRPMPLEAQMLVAAAILPVAFVVFWWRGRAAVPANATVRLQRRKSRLIGLRASVMRKLGTGRGKVQLNDAIWTVLSSEDFRQGELVEVAGYTDNMLEVRPVRDG